MESLVNKGNNQINWELILSSWDTIKYFTKSELVDISRASISIRSILLPHIFKSVALNNISYYLDDPDELPPYELVPTENSNRVLDRNREHLKSLIPHVKSLVSEDEYNESLLISIPQVFYGLNRLQFSDTAITLATFHKLMSGLNHLEHLTLNHPTIIAFDVRNAPITLKLPSSLISFKISYGELIRADFIPGLGIGDYLADNDEFKTEILNFNIKEDSLPRLKLLEIVEDDQDFIDTQNNLISASSQLSHLITRYSLIDEEAIIKIQFLNSLTIINNYQLTHNYTDFNFLSIKMLKELKIIGALGLVKHDGSMTSRFKKLINMAKYVERLTLPFIRSYNFSIEDILQNFERLEELSFIKTGNLVSLNPDTLPKTIKSVNLYGISPKFVDFKTIKHCSKLEVISINYRNENYSSSEFEYSEFSKNIKGWRVVHFPGISIKCYKDKNQPPTPTVSSVSKELYATMRNNGKKLINIF
ncbi:hypothetical protein CONCODRAFT_78284, partial [Conidiobolus coronatus NRRL 28638]